MRISTLDYTIFLSADLVGDPRLFILLPRIKVHAFVYYKSLQLILTTETDGSVRLDIESAIQFHIPLDTPLCSEAVTRNVSLQNSKNVSKSNSKKTEEKFERLKRQKEIRSDFKI